MTLVVVLAPKDISQGGVVVQRGSRSDQPWTGQGPRGCLPLGLPALTNASLLHDATRPASGTQAILINERCPLQVIMVNHRVYQDVDYYSREIGPRSGPCLEVGDVGTYHPGTAAGAGAGAGVALCG